MLRVEAIDKDSDIYPEFKRLYHKSFPKDEQVPLRYLLGHPNDTEIEAYYDDNEFCGFYCALIFDDILNIMFFAIEEKMRDHGFGSMVLDSIKQRHQGYRIILDIEEPEIGAKNNDQRLIRKKFYLHNGFKETNVIYNWHGEDYQMMVYGGELTSKEYEHFMSHLDIKRKKELD